MSNFENINLNGIGNLLDLSLLTVERLIELVSSNENYALYIANKPIPPGWPVEIMQFSNNATNRQKTNSWYMTLDGSKWLLFYSFDVESYLKLNSYPAFIYEKKIIEKDLVAYRPIVSLSIALDGRIEQALKTRTDQMVEAALHPATCHYKK